LQAILASVNLASWQAGKPGKRAKGADGWQSCLLKLISASPAGQLASQLG